MKTRKRIKSNGGILYNAPAKTETPAVKPFKKKPVDIIKKQVNSSFKVLSTKNNPYRYDGAGSVIW